MRPWRGLAAAAVVLGSGCASPLKVGTRKGGEVVLAEGSSVEEAERRAVHGLLGVYMTPAAEAASIEVLDQKVLAKAKTFVARLKVFEAPVRGGTQTARILAQVDYLKLGKELESLNLIRPEGVRGRPRLLLSLKETGPGAGKDVGRASDALRRALVERGYVVADLSDLIERLRQKSGAPAEAREAAKVMGAGLLVTGTAEAAPVQDERLEGYRPYKAAVAIEAVSPSSGEVLSSWVAEATALDAQAEGAAAKALVNAGELAAEKLRAWLATRYAERSEVFVMVAGVRDLTQARALIEAMRRLPRVAGAALDAFRSPEVRIRVFVESVPADELTAALLRMKPYAFEVRAVEPDYNSIELELVGPSRGERD